MKNIFLILYPLLCFKTVYSNAQGNCQVPPELNIYYPADFNALAVQYQLTTADSDQVNISTAYYNEITEGMAGIFNSTFPERDSIFDQYCVHWHYGVSLCQSYLVFFDSTYAWTHAWQNTQTVTGHPAIDNLLSTHALYVDQYFSWAIGEAVLIQSSVNGMLNYDALFDSLMMVPGIISCESNSLIGTAGVINYTKTGNTRHYEFKFEWNDCFDGCDNMHSWFFDVDNNCSVTFTGTTDWWAFSWQPLPVPLNCNITSGIKNTDKNEMELFPNPVSGNLYIRLTKNDGALLKIYNASGSMIFSQWIFSENSFIDFKNFSKGIYLVQLNMKGHIVTKKIIRE